MPSRNMKSKVVLLALSQCCGPTSFHPTSNQVAMVAEARSVAMFRRLPLVAKSSACLWPCFRDSLAEIGVVVPPQFDPTLNLVKGHVDSWANGAFAIRPAPKCPMDNYCGTCAGRHQTCGFGNLSLATVRHSRSHTDYCMTK